MNSGILGFRHERIALLPRHRCEAAAFLPTDLAEDCGFRKMLKVKIYGGVRGERFEADYGPIEALSAKAARRTAEGKFTKRIH